MSLLTRNVRTVNETPNDGVFVIYGNNGTGKTALAATFPKTKEKPMLFLDFLERGTKSIATEDRENIQVLEISNFADLGEVLQDILRGYTFDEDGNKLTVAYSTIVFDCATQMEFLLKEYLMKADKKNRMTLQLWGDCRQEQDTLYNLCKLLNSVTNANIVVICHQKEVTDDENQGNNKIIPSLMNSAAYSLCAKASYVWYTKVEDAPIIDEKSNKVIGTEHNFYTYIDSCQAYLTKTRKPKEFKIPSKVKNLTYSKFAEKILSKI